MPVHLMVTVAMMCGGIWAGREIGQPSFDGGAGVMLMHPFTIGGFVLVLVVAAVVMRRMSRKVTAGGLALACFFLGMALIRFSDYGGASSPRDVGGEDVFMQYAEQQRNRLSDIYAANGVRGDEKAVVTAMTLGDRNGVSRSLRQAYGRSSAAHVFALSGLHIGILFAFLAYLLPRRRYPLGASLLMVAVIWGYTSLVGFRASIVRASIMISVYTLMPLLGRRPVALATVLTTCLFLLVLKPSWLFDAGFRMSFLAVGSIVVFFKYLYVPELLPWAEVPQYAECFSRPMLFGHALVPGVLARNGLLTLVRWVYSVSVVSLAAQIAVMPFVYGYFGTFSPWFLLTNIVVSPCALIIIPVAIVMLVLGSLPSCIPFLDVALSLCGKVLVLVTHVLNAWVEWVASLPGNVY